ncbi:hypothetical protein CSQ80_06620 [Cyanobacterium aponinum IPPAS B-1201]|nr:hypothetical protein CSQ80_06620 [Cyanobacterium aponinum IPPAS B-1201]
MTPEKLHGRAIMFLGEYFDYPEPFSLDKAPETINLSKKEFGALMQQIMLFSIFLKELSNDPNKYEKFKQHYATAEKLADIVNDHFKGDGK